MTEPAEDGRRRNSRPPLGEIGAATMIAALVLAPWIPAIVRGAMPHFMDTVTQFFPYRRLVGVLLAGGDAPFWNPSMFGGVPLLANPQVGALYPGHIPFFVYPTGGMFTLTLAFHVALASAGMYGLLRRLRCSRAASCFGALALGWNGWAWAHFAFGSFHQVWAWWPWLWWFALAWIERSGKGWRAASVALAVLMTLQVLAGAPQMVFYSVLALALLLAAGWFFGPRPRRSSLVSLLAGVVLAAVLATGWSLPQLLPTRAYFEECLRTEALPVEEVRGGALSAADLARSFLGGAGSPEDAESTAFFGALWLALAGIGLVARRPRKENVVVGLIVLLGALLGWRPLCGVWSAILPGFSHMHDPRRALALCATALPILAAFGLDRLADSSIRHSAAARRWMEFGGLFSVCVIVGRFGIRAAAAEPYADPRALPAAMGWLGPWAFWSEWGMTIAAAVAVAVAAGIAWIPIGGGAQSWRRRRAWAVAALGAWGAYSLLVFAVNRIDLKVMSPAAPGGLLDQARETRDRLNALKAALPPVEKGVPLCVYAFDPTGHYSYDYARPDAGRWLLPNAAALTWEGGDATPGLRDAQGYDPALPRRMAAFMGAVNEGHIQWYPRHFALVRAPRGPLAPRLGARAAIGPVNAYVVPLLPPRLEPGQERIAPIEEPSGYRRLRLAVAAAMSDGEEPLRIDATLLDAGRLAVWRGSFEFTRDSVAKGSGWMEKTEALDGDVSRAVAVALRLSGPANPPPVSAIAALEGGSGSTPSSIPGFTPLDLVSTGSLQDSPGAFALDSPTLFGLAEARSYLHLTGDARLVPFGEEARTITRMLARSPETTVLEWPADAPEPPVGRAPRATRETPSPDAPDAAGEVRLVSWRPGLVEAEARVVAEKGAALVIREPYFAGWSATVDGEPRETVPADIAFQAVWLGPGTHAVRWTYRPPGFRMGLLAAAMATLLAVALVIGGKLKEKKEAASPRRESDESES